jgi:small subunit ribosomal protein S3
MGQKIHPKSVRIGYIQDWSSRWFSPKFMPEFIGEDYEIRNMIKERFHTASVSRVDIERAGSFLKITIHTARPGIVIGRRGIDIENLKKDIEKLTSRKVFVNVAEIKKPEIDAMLVGQSIAFQIEKRISYKRAMKRAMERTMQSGALGIKVMISGRLGGNEIARKEWARKGRVPLQTFSADIDYGFVEANTVMGKIGVKVWIFKKLVFAKTRKDLVTQLKEVESQEPAVEAPAVEVKKTEEVKKD